MAYSDAQAKAKARQIFDRFGAKIRRACAGSIVEESFLAGFIGVEAGIDSHGRIKESATRFEPHVFANLKAVRDGLRRSYNRITKADLAGVSDDALRNLAKSWGLTQIMAWHLIKNLKGTVADLRDPEKHLGYAVELLILTAKSHLKNKNYGNVLRIWNTGSANGKTYHADYVKNALKVKKFYEEILKTTPVEIEPETEEFFDDEEDFEAEVEEEDQSAPEPPLIPEPDEPPVTAQIPKIDTEKSWLKRLGTGIGLANVAAFWAGLPQYVQIGLFILLCLLVIGGVIILVNYRREVFSYVFGVHEINADPTQKNIVIESRA